MVTSMPRGKAGSSLPGLELSLQDLEMLIDYLGTQVSVHETYPMEGGNPIIVFRYLMGIYRGKGARPFFEVCRERMTDHRHKWLQRKFQLEIRKKKSSQRESSTTSTQAQRGQGFSIP